MSNQVINQPERYEIIFDNRITENIQDNFYSNIAFNNAQRTSFPNIEKEALLINCLFLLRDLFYLDKNALMEASDNLRDIFNYHQESSTYELPRLQNASKIVTGEIVETETLKPPTTFEFLF